MLFQNAENIAVPAQFLKAFHTVDGTDADPKNNSHPMNRRRI